MDSVSEQLREQFLLYERHGRGWDYCPWPSRPEPPAWPFPGYRVEGSEAVDDARIAPLWEKAWKGLGGLFRLNQGSEEEAPTFDPNRQPGASCHYDAEDLIQLELSSPREFNPPIALWARLLTALPRPTGTLGFEILKAERRVRPHFVVSKSQAREVSAQLRAHFPELGVIEAPDDWEACWGSGDDGHRGSVLDLALSDTWMLPLNLDHPRGSDPLTALYGALDALPEDETALLQLHFMPCRQPWANELMSALAPAGEVLFSDAKELLRRGAGKLGSQLFGVRLSLAVRTESEELDWRRIQTLCAALRPLCDPGANSLLPLEEGQYDAESRLEDLMLRQSWRYGMLLSAEELALFVHAPSASVRVESLRGSTRTTRPAPAAAEQASLVLGRNEHLGQVRPVTLSPSERSRHTYIIGASGTGKSTLLESMIAQDMEQGAGVALLDPHGDLVDAVLARVPEERIEDVVLVDPSDAEFAVAFNILDAHSNLERQLLGTDLVGIFRRLSTSWGDQMTSVLANAVLAFLESSEGGTLLDLRRFLVEPGYRDRFVTTVADEEVRYFWQREFNLLSGRPQAPLLTRLDAFLRPKLIRHMVAQRESRLGLPRHHGRAAHHARKAQPGCDR